MKCGTCGGEIQVQKVCGVTVKFCPTCADEKEREAAKLEAFEQQHSAKREIGSLIFNAGFPDRQRLSAHKWESFDSEHGQIFGQVRDWVENSLGNLLMVGNPGTGKTTLAVWAGLARCERGDTVLFKSSFEIMQLLKAEWERERELTASLVKPDLLILDELDIFSGGADGYAAKFLGYVIGKRYDNFRPTIATSNATVADLEKLLGARTIDRFREQGTCLVCNWKSYRTKKQEG